MIEPTARDALLAELLGDVGKLHDQLKTLPAGIRDALEPSMKEVLTASAEARRTVVQLVDAERVVIQRAGAEQLMQLQAELRATLREEAAALTQAVGERPTPGGARMRQFALVASVALGSLAGSLLGLAGGYLMFGQDQEEAARLGRATGAVWEDLDGKAKRAILGTQAREAAR